MSQPKPPADTTCTKCMTPWVVHDIFKCQKKQARFAEESMKDLKPVGQKAPLSLLPLNALGAVAGVMEHGAIKYSPWNWMDDSQAQARMEELVNACLRHALAIQDPSQPEFDEESGLHHMAHVATTALIYLHKRGVKYRPSALLSDKKD